MKPTKKMAVTSLFRTTVDNQPAQTVIQPLLERESTRMKKLKAKGSSGHGIRDMTT